MPPFIFLDLAWVRVPKRNPGRLRGLWTLLVLGRVTVEEMDLGLVPSSSLTSGSHSDPPPYSYALTQGPGTTQTPETPHCR